jgi:hypothetical protein
MVVFAVAYSPGLGPIPFTLASESFPLSHREAGTAWPISINLLFAGLLSIFYPRYVFASCGVDIVFANPYSVSRTLSAMVALSASSRP